MKRVILLVVVGAVVLAAGGNAAPTPPSLVVVGKQPLVVRGAHFRANEWVRLTAFSNGITSKRVRTTRLGTFVAVLPLLRYGRCNGFGLRATGSLGSRASFGLKLPLPGCLPATPSTSSP